MAVLRSRPVARSFSSTYLIDALVALAGLLMCATFALLTPAFTDYEEEAEPAVTALLHGHFSEGLHLLPLYGSSVLAEMPLAFLAHAFGGGSLAVFRALAIPGAIGVAWLAMVASSWLRAHGRRRAVQLVALGALVTSTCLIQSWQTGHHEEALIASLALGGLILVLKDTDRSAIFGGVLMGAAAGGKMWAVVLLPVALVATTTRGRAWRLTAAAAVSGALVALPIALSRIDTYSTQVSSTGGGGIFSTGNLWWFLGHPNPVYNDGHVGMHQMHSITNSARLAPGFIGEHAHEMIVLTAAALAGIWWLLARRHRAAEPADASAAEAPPVDGQPLTWAGRIGAALGDPRVPTADQRAASILMLAAAVLWWRGLADTWYQPYYLIPATMALVLADARRGRLPLAGLVAWGAFWLVDGQNNPTMSLLPDAKSAITLAWMVPFGIWTTVMALRSAR